MELKDIKKFTFIINTVILVLVFMLAAFFVYCKATFLIWFSIPTALVYVVGYFLIKNERLEIYTRVVYFWLIQDNHLVVGALFPVVVVDKSFRVVKGLLVKGTGLLLCFKIRHDSDIWVHRKLPLLQCPVLQSVMSCFQTGFV